MMELSPEEREKIYLEEKARLEVRQEIGREKKVGITIAAPFAMVLFFLFLVTLALVKKSPSSGYSEPEPSTPSVPVGLTTTLGTSWCTESLDDAGPLWRAVNRQDTARVLGLLASGQALEIEAGTRVYVSTASYDENGLTRAVIQSGFHTGRNCYLSSRVLASYPRSDTTK